MGTLVFQATLGGSVNLIGPNTASTVNFTLPSADGTSGQALATNGSGTLAFSSFATLVSNTFTGSQTLSAGTANGVTYLNGSKVLTSGSALTYNGTNLGITGTTSDVKTIITATTGAPYTQYTNSSSTFYVGKENSAGTSFGVTAYSSVLFESANYPIVFATNSTEQMRLTSTQLLVGGSSTDLSSVRASIIGSGGFAVQNASTSGTYLQVTPSAANGNVDIKADARTGGYPAITFTTSATTRATLDASGNLGLGVTPSAWRSTIKATQIGQSGSVYSNTNANAVVVASNDYVDSAGADRYIATGYATLYQQVNGQHQFYNAASGTAGNAISFTQAMTLDANGNLCIGSTSVTNVSGYKTISLQGSTQGGIFESTTGSYSTKTRLYSTDSGGFVGTTSNHFLGFLTNDTERARIDSSGNLLVGVTSGSVHTLSKSNSNDIAAQINNTSSSNCYGLRIQTTAVASNSASFYLLRCADSSATRADIRADGGLANYSANNANLSDQRVKTDIQNAGGYLKKICAIPVRTFKYKDQTDDLLNLGCIAQEVEAVAPELIDASGFGETPEDGVPLKAIYQTDLQYALMKCIQEQQAIIESLKARLDAANL